MPNFHDKIIHLIFHFKKWFHPHLCYFECSLKLSYQKISLSVRGSVHWTNLNCCRMYSHCRILFALNFSLPPSVIPYEAQLLVLQCEWLAHCIEWDKRTLKQVQKQWWKDIMPILSYNGVHVSHNKLQSIQFFSVHLSYLNHKKR